MRSSSVSTTVPRLQAVAADVVAEEAAEAAKTASVVEAAEAPEVTTAEDVEVAASAVAVAAVVVPELPESKARAPMSTVLRPVASAIATRARPVRMLTLWTDVTVPAAVAEATVRKVRAVEAGEETDHPKMRSTRVALRRRPRLPAVSSASPSPLSRRKKLASLLMTSTLRSRPSPRACSLRRLSLELERRLLTRFRIDKETRSVS